VQSLRLHAAIWNRVATFEFALCFIAAPGLLSRARPTFLRLGAFAPRGLADRVAPFLSELEAAGAVPLVSGVAGGQEVQGHTEREHNSAWHHS